MSPSSRARNTAIDSSANLAAEPTHSSNNLDAKIVNHSDREKTNSLFQSSADKASQMTPAPEKITPDTSGTSNETSLLAPMTPEPRQVADLDPATIPCISPTNHVIPASATANCEGGEGCAGAVLHTSTEGAVSPLPTVFETNRQSIHLVDGSTVVGVAVSSIPRVISQSPASIATSRLPCMRVCSGAHSCGRCTRTDHNREINTDYPVTGVIATEPATEEDADEETKHEENLATGMLPLDEKSETPEQQRKGCVAAHNSRKADNLPKNLGEKQPRMNSMANAISHGSLLGFAADFGISGALISTLEIGEIFLLCGGECKRRYFGGCMP